VQRRHELGAEPLGVGVLRHQRGELRNRVDAGGQFGVEAFGEHRQAQFAEPGGLGHQRTGVEVGQGGPVPQRGGPPVERHGLVGPAAVDGAAGLGGQFGEDAEIDLEGIDVEHVAGRVGAQDLRPDRRPQPVHRGVHLLACGRRCRVPGGLDQFVDADQPVRAQQEQRQRRPFAPSAGSPRPVVGADLEWTE
jgi:hypothetical protein